MTTFSSTDLAEMFQHQAEWRRQKAVEYPKDTRNLEAAAILERLAATAEDVHSDIIRAFAELEGDSEDSETLSEMMREVGFQSEPQTALEFVEPFIASRTGG